MRIVIGKFFYNFTLAITFFTLSFAFVQAQSLDELEKKIIELTKKQKELEQKAIQYKSLLAGKTKEITSLENTISYLTAQINRLENEISRTTLNIQQLEYEIRKLDLKMEQILKEISQKKEYLANLIRKIYEKSRVSFLEMFLINETFSDFYNEKQNLNSLQSQIRAVIIELKLNHEKIAQLQQDIKQKKTDLEKSKQKLAFQEEELLNQKEQKNKILTQTKGEQKKYSAILSQVQKEEADLWAEIAKLEQLVEKSRNFIVYKKATKIPPPGTKIFSYPLEDFIITQGYGMTSYAKTGVYAGKGHNGIDLSSGFGSEVKAPADGVVIAKNYNSCPNFAKTSDGRKCGGGWGNWVAIEHDGGLVTTYAHLHSLSPRNVGEAVKKGDIIGREGSSGFSTGSHLHFSVYSEFFTYRSPTGELLFKYGDGANPSGTLNPFDYL